MHRGWVMDRESCIGVMHRGWVMDRESWIGSHG